MPVLPTREAEFGQWLMGTPEEAFALAQQYPPEGMWIVREGFDKLDWAEHWQSPADKLEKSEARNHRKQGPASGRINAYWRQPNPRVRPR